MWPQPSVTGVRSFFSPSASPLLPPAALLVEGPSEVIAGKLLLLPPAPAPALAPPRRRWRRRRTAAWPASLMRANSSSDVALPPWSKEVEGPASASSPAPAAELEALSAVLAPPLFFPPPPRGCTVKSSRQMGQDWGQLQAWLRRFSCSCMRRGQGRSGAGQGRGQHSQRSGEAEWHQFSVHALMASRQAGTHVLGDTRRHFSHPSSMRHTTTHPLELGQHALAVSVLPLFAHRLEERVAKHTRKQAEEANSEPVDATVAPACTSGRGRGGWSGVLPGNAG